MATFVVSNYLVGPDGSALAGVKVYISIKPENAFRISDGAELVSPLSLVSDATGFWTTPLEDNLNISPAGSYYEVVEQVPPIYGGTQIWNIYVNGAGGRLGQLWSSQVPPPPYIPVYEGPMGPQGPPGPQGPAGTSGGFYMHDQSVPAATWTVVHNLGYNPAGIFVTDSSGSDVEGEVTYVNTNQLTLTFSAAFSGKAYVS
jgi:hypothetical protein